MAEYWIRASDKIHGPFSSRELKGLIAKGKLRQSHEVSPDQTRWKPAGEVKGLTFPDSSPPAIPDAAEPTESVTPPDAETVDTESDRSKGTVSWKQRVSWLEVRHFLAANRISVAVALLLCLAALHYLVISPWLHFSKVLSAAEEGNVPAQMEVALLYETGTGTWQSYPDALKWYASAAENGDMNAMFLLYGAVASERSGDETRLVLTSTDGRGQRPEITKELMEKNPLLGLVTMLAEAHQDDDSDRPLPSDDVDKFNYAADPLASAFLTKQAGDGSAIAMMQLANVAHITEKSSTTTGAGAVEAGLLSFLIDASNANGFDQKSSAVRAFQALSDVANQLNSTEDQE
ncbi:MAG: GYF domain-containing protein [Planctomycetota bacterium]